MTEEQKSLVLHALGLTQKGKRKGGRWSHRNYFCAGEKDNVEWESLVKQGYAILRNNPSDVFSFYTYSVTKSGMVAAGVLHRVKSEDFPPETTAHIKRGRE